MKHANLSINDTMASFDDCGMSLELIGFYMRLMLTAMRRDGDLRDDDAQNARMMRLDVRTYRRLLQALLSHDLLSRGDDKLVMMPVAQAVEAYQTHRNRAAEGGRKRAEQQRSRSTSAELPANFPPKSEEISRGDGSSISRLAPANPSPSPTPTKNPPLVPLSSCQPLMSLSVAFGAEKEKGPSERSEVRSEVISFNDRVRLENGRLIVCDEFRREWVERLGSEERFDLALVQAVVYIQPNSWRPLEAQLAAQLARSAADKLDRDARYAAASRKLQKPSSCVSRFARVG
jgi:hypothetical protein